MGSIDHIEFTVFSFGFSYVYIFYFASSNRTTDISEW